MSTNVAARVRFSTPGRSDAPRDPLVVFLPMGVVGTLRGCQSAPSHARPFLDVCGELTDALLACDAAAAPAFRLKEAIEEPWADIEDLYTASIDGSPTEDMIECWLRQCLPEVAEEPAGGHHRRLKAELKLPRRAGGVPYVTPWSRNSFTGIQGTLAMFEAVARSRDYQATTRPAAAVTRRVLDFNEEAFGGGIPAFAEATWLYQLADALSVENDPLSSEPRIRFAGTDEDQTPGEAIFVIKMGRWIQESGLSEHDATRLMIERDRLGQPMPWDHHKNL